MWKNSKVKSLTKCMIKSQLPVLFTWQLWGLEMVQHRGIYLNYIISFIKSTKHLVVQCTFRIYHQEIRYVDVTPLGYNNIGGMDQWVW